MADACLHLAEIRTVSPSALGCEECLKVGSPWVHLRLCRTCGHVGCCDSSPQRHATKHFRATRHPIIEGYDPPEGWGWCYIDEVSFDLTGRNDAAEGPDPAVRLKRAAPQGNGVSAEDQLIAVYMPRNDAEVAAAPS